MKLYVQNRPSRAHENRQILTETAVIDTLRRSRQLARTRGTSVIRFHFAKIGLPFSAFSICALALLAGACGTTETPTPILLPDVKADNGQADLAQDDGTDAITPDTLGKDSATDVEQDSGPDSATDEIVEVVDIDLDLGDPDSGEQPDTPDVPPLCGGKAFCPCAENTDCLSGACLQDSGAAKGKACAALCNGKCGAGYTCQTLPSVGDPVSVCVQSAAKLCQPCALSSDCTMLGSPVSACVNEGPLGNFCGLPCQATPDCPATYLCADVTSTEGVASKQCVKEPAGSSGDYGTCGCSNFAVTEKLETPCYFPNLGSQGQLISKCVGSRVCGESGLSICSAIAPTAETCDGVDNDCNGQTDEFTCADKNDCTDDSCGGKAGCQNAANSLACSDDNVCTLADACKGGLCLPGSASACDDDNVCTDDSCDPQAGCTFLPNTITCTDGSICTLDDACAEKKCVPGKAKVCDDANVCTDDSCDGTLGCLALANTLGCEDGSVCTLSDLCAEGKCSAGTPKSCDDNNPCTDESCDAITGCASAPNGGACNDGSVCTENDKCDGVNCAPGVATLCDDKNLCTNDSCDAKKGCLFLPNAVPCDDLNPCTVNDACFGGKCEAGKPKNCDDANTCTTDSCDVVKVCVATNNALSCDDNNACTSGDSCANAACAGKATPCDDKNPCTLDSCDAIKGCSAAPTNEGADCSADALNWCVAGKCIAKPSCGDGVVNQASEECDDGNADASDTCNACAWSCAQMPFDGVNVMLADNPAVAAVSSVTAAFWVKATKSALFLDKKTATYGGHSSYSVGYLNGKLYSRVQIKPCNGQSCDNTEFLDLVGPALPLGVWQHLALTYDAATGSAVLWLNGASVASGIKGNGLAKSAVDALGLGAAMVGNTSGGFGHVGGLAHVRIWSVALNQAGILADIGGKPQPAALVVRNDGAIGAKNWSAVAPEVVKFTSIANPLVATGGPFCGRKCGDAIVSLGEQCDDGNKNNGDGCDNSCQSEGKVSCKAILAASPGISSGLYYIDPDDAGPLAPYQTYCDMFTDGGGWTLVAHANNAVLAGKLTADAGAWSPLLRDTSGNKNSVALGKTATEIAYSWATVAPNSALVVGYDYAFKHPLAGGTTWAGTGDGGSLLTCTQAPFASVAVTCLKGTCALPATMYTRGGGLGTCFGSAYGVVASAAPSNFCDWAVDPQLYKAFYLRHTAAPAGCEGWVKTPGGAPNLSVPKKAAVWIR